VERNERDNMAMRVVTATELLTERVMEVEEPVFQAYD
jgi:hypothetical protein